MNVGVAPTVLLPWRIVKLCASGEVLVKLKVTLPEFTCSEVVVNARVPLGSALTDAACPELAEVDVAGAVDPPFDAGVEALVELLELLDPQAARVSAKDIRVSGSAAARLMRRAS
jgi:hypothetical protein